MTNKPKAFFVISSYNNDISWIESYTDNYVIYDKSNSLFSGNKIIKTNNVGYNVFDICHFTVNNYQNLPELVAFLEGNPFDHCKKETFDKLIYKEEFTPLEDYSDLPESHAYKKAEDGGYSEINNSWYIESHVETHGKEVNRYFKSYNDFLDEMFESPAHPNYIRFSPGAQYVVPRKNILFYSKSFWEKLMGYVDYHRTPSEAHIIERALYYIFSNRWEERT